MNLVSMIMQFLAPAIINKMAANLGVGQGLVGKAITAAIPSILAGLAGAASKSGGAAQLASALGKQDPGLLGNFASMIGGSNSKGLIDSGSSVLSSLLGGSSTGALAGAIGKFAGVNDSQCKSLLGMLAPVVFGTLAKEQKSSKLDAGGLASLLNGQKSNIAAAMPAGFSDLLAGSGLLDSIAGNLKGAGDGAKRTAQEVDRKVERSDIPGSAPSFNKYLLPLALAALALYFVTGRMGHRDAPMSPPPAATTAPATHTAAPGVDLTGQARGVLDSLTASLGGIKDEASAKSAMPKLQDILGQVTKLKDTAQALPADARHPLVVMISGFMPGFASTIDKVMAIPGVSGVLKPVMDQIMANLGALGKA